MPFLSCASIAFSLATLASKLALPESPSNLVTAVPFIATTSDIDSVRLALRDEIGAVRVDMDKGLQALRADLEKTETRLEVRIAETKADILKWMFGAIGLQTVVIIGALLAIIRGTGHN